MAIYNANKMAAGTQAKYVPTASGVNVVSTFAAPLNPALLTNDVINFLQIEAEASNPNGQGPTITGITLDCQQIDTGAAVKINVGDAGNAARFINQTTVGQAGGIAYANVPGTIGYQPEASAFSVYPTTSLAFYTIFATIQTQPGAMKAGNLVLLAEYTYDP